MPKVIMINPLGWNEIKSYFLILFWRPSMSKKIFLVGTLCMVLVFNLAVINAARAHPSSPAARPAALALAGSSGVKWGQVSLDGFGDPSNALVTSLEEFGGKLYAGASNWVQGGQIWSSDDGAMWTAVSPAGFGSTDPSLNAGMIDMVAFKDQLYVSTGWGGSAGQIWRSPDGTDWTQVEGEGFGDPGNTAIMTFGIFSDMLYVTTQSSNGLEIWRSPTGDSADWSRVVEAGNGNANNNSSTSLMEFGGSLYAAVENGTDGAEIWRTNNGTTWTAVKTGGFGSTANIQTGGFAILNGYLYVGTRNDATGGQIWRTSNGTLWTAMVSDGFGDLNNTKIEALMSFDGALYAGTANSATGIEVWRSSNGSTWQQVNLDGFENGNNSGTVLSFGTAAFHQDLYIGTHNDVDGGQVWTMVSPRTDFASSLSAGQYHTCAVTSEGGARCWGKNATGQLGDIEITDRHTPVDVLHGVGFPVSGLKLISAGAGHTCAVSADGRAMCWGDNAQGQLGNNSLQTPFLGAVEVAGLASGTDVVSAGGVHTCALTAGGGARCWGYGPYGQIGNGTNNGYTAPQGVSGLSGGVRAISAGWGHTCALTTAGAVKCWGYNNHGQLGDNSTSNRNAPVAVNGLSSGVTAISAGLYHTCALTAGHGVRCWGDNGNGQLGDNTNTDHWIPADVSGLTSGVKAISAGWYYTCALMEAGGVKCWGSNLRGQLGDWSNEDRWTPVDVWELSGGIAAISAGGYHTCVLMTNGGIKCWGDNSNGQLGDGSPYDRWTPADVVELKAILPFYEIYLPLLLNKP
jgi:alpha-tubulin suppressor-like RCC1 family protein